MCTSGWSKHSRDIEALREAGREPGAYPVDDAIKEALMADQLSMDGLIMAVAEVFLSNGYRGGSEVNRAIEIALDQHYRRRAAA